MSQVIYFEPRMKANDTKTETKPLSLLSLFLSFMALFCDLSLVVCAYQ